MNVSPICTKTDEERAKSERILSMAFAEITPHWSRAHKLRFISLPSFPFPERAPLCSSTVVGVILCDAVCSNTWRRQKGGRGISHDGLLSPVAWEVQIRPRERERRISVACTWQSTRYKGGGRGKRGCAYLLAWRGGDLMQDVSALLSEDASRRLQLAPFRQ